MKRRQRRRTRSASVIFLFIFAQLASCVFAADVGDVIEEASDPAEMQRVLEEWRDQPFDLNTVTAEKLSLLPEFTVDAARAFVEWRRTHAPLRSLESLQACALLTPAQRAVLLDYSRLSEEYAPSKQTLRASGRVLDSETTESDSRLFASIENGKQLRGYLRADRYQPAGEYLDRISGGLSYAVERLSLQMLAGDFELDFGTGLMRSSGWGAASWLGNRERLSPELGRGLVSRSSSNRLHGFRGVGAECLQDLWKVALLASRQELDAAMTESGARITEGTSTTAELSQARADQLSLTSGGVSAGVRRRSWRVEFLGLHHEFSDAVTNDLTHDSFRRLDMAGAAAGATAKNLRAVGEVAFSGTQGRAWNVALSGGNSLLGASGYASYANEYYFSPGGSAWGSFGSEGGNLERVGVRGTIACGPGVFFVHGFQERRLAAMSDQELSNPRETIEMSYRTDLNRELESDLLAARTWRGDITAGSPVDIELDRLRFTLRGHGALPFKLRAEWRSSLRSGGQDHAQGTYLLAEVAPRIKEWKAAAQMTGFSFDNDDVATSIYERTVGAEFPLVALSGTGARSMVMISRDFGALSAGIKGVYFHRDLRGGITRGTEAALQISYRSTVQPE